MTNCLSRDANTDTIGCARVGWALGWFIIFFLSFIAQLTPLNSGSAYRMMISIKKVRVILVKNKRSLASKFMK